MLKDSKTIQRITYKYNDHPIHIKMFFSQCKLSILSEDECDKEYFKYLEGKPKPFVKWVGAMFFLTSG